MTITATYHAPDGDNEVVTMRGVRFFDGQSVDIDNAGLAAKLRGNPHFEVTGDDAPAAQVQPLTAKHRGRGIYSVVQGDETVVEGLNKTDADAFNAMNDADKATFVQQQLEDAPPPPAPPAA